MAAKKQTARDRESALKKAKIYQVAISLFKEYGYDNTTMDDICEASGMSKGSIYHFFSKKIDLIHNFFEELNKRSIADLEINDKNLDNPAAVLLNHCIDVASAYEQIGFDLSVQMHDFYKGSAESANFVPNVVKFITAAQEKGTIHGEVNAVEIANCIHIAVAGTFRKWILDSAGYSFTDAAKWFLPIMINLFVDEKYKIEQGPCPDRFRKL